MASLDGFQTLLQAHLDLLPRLAEQHDLVVAQWQQRCDELLSERQTTLELAAPFAHERPQLCLASNGANLKHSGSASASIDEKIGHGWVHESRLTHELDMLDNDYKPIGKDTVALLQRWGLYDRIASLTTLKEPRRIGRLAAIVDCRQFEFVCMIIIFANALFAIHVANWQFDHLGEQQLSWIRLVEWSFLFCFVVELVLKFCVHRFFLLFGAEASWNWLDCALVAGSLLDAALALLMVGSNVSILRVARVLKIVKVLRVLRILRYIRDLRLILECLLHSFMSVVWSIVLVLFMNFFFSVLFVQGMASWIGENGSSADPQLLINIEERFGSVHRAMLSLFQVTFGGVDWGDIYKDVIPTGVFYCFVFLSYVILLQMAVLNIITSLFVEKAMKLATPSIQEQLVEKRKEDKLQAGRLLRIVRSHMDVHNTGYVTHEAVTAAIATSDVRAAFEFEGIPMKDAQGIFSAMTAGCGNYVRVETFVAACLRMKGYAMSADVQTLKMDTERISARVQDIMSQMQQQGVVLEKLLEHFHSQTTQTPTGIKPQLDKLPQVLERMNANVERIPTERCDAESREKIMVIL